MHWNFTCFFKKFLIKRSIEHTFHLHVKLYKILVKFCKMCQATWIKREKFACSSNWGSQSTTLFQLIQFLSVILYHLPPISKRWKKNHPLNANVFLIRCSPVHNVRCWGALSELEFFNSPNYSKFDVEYG